MKEIFIIHAHWNNRGDEAAVRAMMDELLECDEDIHLSLQINSNELHEIEGLEEQGINVLHNRFPKKKDFPEVMAILASKGRITFSARGKEFVKTLKNADMVVHAPGGPSIGDIYKNAELPYLMRFLMAKRLGKKYFFYAPSMGPFTGVRNSIRKRVLKNASAVILREKISENHVKNFVPDVKTLTTLDSAFQHDVDIEKNEKLLDNYTELKCFLNKYDKCIGITITDLQWNPLYSGKDEIKNNIRESFENFIKYLKEQGFGVVFVPQLFGSANDRDYMASFALDNAFVVDETYDCYFQQYLISKLYAVVGMRYHSNIFSCKMKIPFISVSYEQKMKGFMESQKLEKYCININDLSFEILKEKFDLLLSEYDEYRNILVEKSPELKRKAHRTTDILLSKLK